MEEMWLARDRDGKLYLFIDSSEPKKSTDTWTSAGYFPTIIEIPRVYFPQIHWYDEKPTKLQLVITNE